MTIQEVITPILRSEMRKFYLVQFELEDIAKNNHGKYPERILRHWKMWFKYYMRRNREDFLKNYYNLLLDLEIEGANSERVLKEELAFLIKFKEKLEKSRESMVALFKRDFHQYS